MLAYFLYFTVIVPSVVGEGVPTARTILAGHNLRAGTPTPVTTLKVPGGTIVRQSPGAQALAARDSLVALDMEESVVVPDVAGRDEQVADRVLGNAPLTVGQTTRVTQGKLPDTVISTSPPGGTRVAPASTADLVVEQYTTVPNVQNSPEDQAVAALQAAHLAYQVVGVVPTCPPGQQFYVSREEPNPQNRVNWNFVVFVVLVCQ